MKSLPWPLIVLTIVLILVLWYWVVGRIIDALDAWLESRGQTSIQFDSEIEDWPVWDWPQQKGSR